MTEADTSIKSLGRKESFRVTLRKRLRNKLKEQLFWSLCFSNSQFRNLNKTSDILMVFAK